LTGLEVRATEEGTLFLGILYDTWMESVLWRSVKVEESLFNGSYAVKYGTGKGLRFLRLCPSNQQHL